MKKFIYEIVETAGAIEAAGNRVLKPFGLTPMSFNILNLLRNSALSQRHLSDKLIVVASSVTFQVRQLQKRGLLKRRRADKRTWLVSLSSVGEELRRAAASEMDKMIARFQLDPAVLEKMVETLCEFRRQIPTAVANPSTP